MDCFAEPVIGLPNAPIRDDVAALGATKQPDGQISKILSSPSHKNIPLNPSGKSPLRLRPSHPMRGALRNVTNVRWDAVDAALAKTNARWLADGEVVWSWRPGAGAKFREKQASQASFSGMTVATSRSPGRARRKP